MSNFWLNLKSTVGAGVIFIVGILGLISIVLAIPIGIVIVALLVLFFVCKVLLYDGEN
jgi:hypothetical protein